ncbi:EcsC family protein [Victivallis sp. Marseille-Q1083]|uniref:EcsC family protein n=1 Tax=Victivallis sp. Marseille-Q1083 TaxID=2717288 RepID=UPI00158A109F|nr:EcsC family protein [Victivallis sp. Marseille-Q1083]
MSEAEESKALQVANWLTEKAVGGVGPLSSAEDLALEYLNDSNYEDNDKRVDSLINWETSKNFSTGFITGLGGFATLPVAIPASLGASWVLQARMAAAIARIYGHDLNEERVKTLILCVIIGQDIKEVCKQAGIKIGTKLTYVAIRKLPSEVLKRINQAVGFRLITKAGEKGIINLTKLVPVVGGVVGGTFDAVTCRITAKAAREAFRQK